jgi:hypothetical protein
MRTLLVVIADKLDQHRCQMLLIQDDEVVQTLAAECPDNAFSNRVRPSRPHGCSDGIDTDPSGALP